MKQLKTKAIVLSRINYREADRIVTVISEDYGKIRLMARGVRNLKSKLAGGIELFTVNDISFIQGRGDISTLVSSRLQSNYANILTDLERVQAGYEFLKTVDKAVQDGSGSEYFYLLKAALSGLNDLRLGREAMRLWFTSRLIAISGHSPNLITEKNGAKLSEDSGYGFDSDAMCFFVQAKGKFTANDVKYLRLAFSSNDPGIIGRVKGAEELAVKLLPLVTSMRSIYLFG